MNNEMVKLNDPPVSPAREPVAAQPRPGSRVALYCTLNLLFLVLLCFCGAFSGPPGHNPLPYLFLLFALCTYPLVMVRESNGRYSLLVIAGPVMFLFFGVNDLLSYFMELKGRFHSQDESLFTQGELVILGGLLCLFLGYLLAALACMGKRRLPFNSDWKTGHSALFGLFCLGIGLYATYLAQISVDYSQKVDMGSNATLIVLGRMMEPVGAVLVTYAYLKRKSTFMLALVLAIAAVKLPIGIILNSKEIGMTFAATFIITLWVYNGKVPARWIALFVLVVIVYFPLSYAYRAALGSKRLSVSKSLGQADTMVEKALAGNNSKRASQSGIDLFAARNDYKTLVEIIVSKAGTKVKFQEGHTLAELPYAFIPRMVYPGKPVVSVGQLFNREFHISADRNTYISTSFLGEMFWNFGWAGALLGMLVMGFFWGVIGSVANIRERATAAKVLILISAVYLLILRFETGLAQQTILFMRSCLIIFLLHLIFKVREGRGLDVVIHRGVPGCPAASP